MDYLRWILCEAWIANGLRVNWGPSYESQHEDWIRSNDGYSFRYRGFGEWQVLDEERGIRLFGEKPVAPSLSTNDMLHELAHWMIATEDQRHETNFGMGSGEGKTTPEQDENERRVVAAEKVIEAVSKAASRIIATAQGARP